MKKEDCWMTFSEALDQYMRATATLERAPVGCYAYLQAQDELQQAKDHMNAMYHAED